MSETLIFSYPLEARAVFRISGSGTVGSEVKLHKSLTAPRVKSNLPPLLRQISSIIPRYSLNSGSTSPPRLRLSTATTEASLCLERISLSSEVTTDLISFIHFSLSAPTTSALITVSIAKKSVDEVLLNTPS